MGEKHRSMCGNPCFAGLTEIEQDRKRRRVSSQVSAQCGALRLVIYVSDDQPLIFTQV